MASRLAELYSTKLRFDLQKKLEVKNIMLVPRISKIVLNIGVKEAASDSKELNKVVDLLSKIAGQKAVKTYAKKSIAGFKLREGVAIGACVTLRSERMYNFFDKLISLALPGVRDFRGVSTKFDGHGGYNLGIKDWFVFPEIDYDTVDTSRGMNITIHTTAHGDNAARALLDSFNMPFKKD